MRRSAAFTVTALLGLAVSVLASGVDAQEKPEAEGPKPGEWALQRDTTIAAVGTQVAYLYVWVAKVDGKKITIMHQLVDSEGKLGLAAPKNNTVESLGDAKLRKPSGTYLEEIIELRGKKLYCRRVEVGGETLWIAPEIPVYGLVRAVVAEKSGRVKRRSDLVDWGATGGSERPTR